MAAGSETGAQPSPRDVLVIGIGNDYRGDDAVGLHVVRRIRAAELDGVEVREEIGDIGDLIDAWVGRDVVLLADAVRSASPPGTVLRFEARAQPIPNIFVPHLSSHGIGLNEAIELGRALDQLPRKLVIYGIEAEAFDDGAALTPAAERAVAEAAERILEELTAPS